MIRLQDIKMKIVSTNKADMNFRMNFIALLINSLIESSSSEKANTNPLNYITSKTKIENIDCCSYLIDSLVKNKQSFDPSNPTSNFNGPSAYLVLLYLDRIKSDVLKFERTCPVICYWTSEKIKMRETFEKDELGDFGIGDFNDEYVDEELNEEAYEQVVINKYRKLDMLIEDEINKFRENITLNHLKISVDAIFKDKSEDNQEKNGNDNVQYDNSDDDEDANGDDNDQSKKKNVGGKNILKENLKGGEEQQRKNKDEDGEDIKITDGEKDENDNNDQAVDVMNIERKNAKKVEGITGEQLQRDGEDGEKDENDNNDQGLDDMNLHDEVVENEKGGNNKEEQNVEGEDVEGMNIERNNAKKVEGITGEQPQRDGEDGEKYENDNNDQVCDYMNLHDEGVENKKGGDNKEQNAEGVGFGRNIDEGDTGEGVENEKGGDNEEEQNAEGEEDVNKTITNVIESIFENTSEFNSTQMLNDDEFNSVYEKTMKEYQDKKEESMMPSYDLNISQLTPTEMTENTAEEKKDEGEKENLVKDVLDPKAKTHPTINIVISKNQNKESLPDLTEKQNVTQEPRQQRKKKPAEVRRSP
ncbi:unnamed protein product [Lactuca virosa]|uniref:Uncharacterized protein n=1 Tax=Lactuca virosa TaxID=75947 RepID=A0AAU9NWA2_9ASTR|nr:unnamed protein product [Lactuca virosa]